MFGAELVVFRTCDYTCSDLASCKVCYSGVGTLDILKQIYQHTKYEVGQCEFILSKNKHGLARRLARLLLLLLRNPLCPLRRPVCLLPTLTLILYCLT